MELLSRYKFRESVFERDKYKCVVCGHPAIDAHHIMERRLFPDGGYYLNNGASLCAVDHLRAESTVISCQYLRDLIGIKEVVLPPQLYRDQEYDKWGNIILPNGKKLRGELAYDESVKKAMQLYNMYHFQDYVKYPRTYHLPWSTMGKYDRMMQSMDYLIGERVVVTLKMDGENTTMYHDHIHARSIDSGSHESRNWVKGLWGKINWMIDPGMRICGENLYAVHTVEYNHLPSYFMLFSIWQDNICLSWDETIEYAKILGLETVPVIFDGNFDQMAIQEAFKQYAPSHEGYVVRLAKEFNYGQFRHVVGKYVQPEFRQTVNQSHGHWISKRIITNKLLVNS